MSLYPVILGAIAPYRQHAPRWFYRRETPRLTNEGDAVQLSIYVTNYNPGSCIMAWMGGGKSLASKGNWERDWHDVFAEALAANGCEYRRLSGSTTPKGEGTLSGLITIGPDYRGQKIFFNNRSRRNRRTDATNPDGSPSYREMQIVMNPQGATGTPERAFNGTFGAFIGGNTVQVQDSSRSPTGAPTMRLRLTKPDGSPLNANVFEGDELRLVVETTNLIPGTVLKLYMATDGNRDITTPKMRSAIADAGEGKGCTVMVPRFDPNNVPAWYNGGAITFTAAYDDDNPIEMFFKLDANTIEEANRQVAFIGQILLEGDAAEFDSVVPRGDWKSGTTYSRGDWVTYLPDGGRYIYTDEAPSSGSAPNAGGRWREYTIIQLSEMGVTVSVRDVPPRFWELRATTDGSIITYTMQGPTGAIGDSIALASNNPPPGFDAALAAACHADAGIHYTGGRLVARAVQREDSAVTFTVPHTGSGKHTLRLSDPIGPSYLVIGDACVFLTPPVLPTGQDYTVGVNLGSGGGGSTWPKGEPSVYGSHYVYNSQPELAEPRTHQEMDYHWGKGVRILRVGFQWERLQPVPFGPLFGGGGTGSWTTPNRQDLRRLHEQVWYWTQVLGGIVLLDNHNYMGFEYQDGRSGKLAYEAADHNPAMLVDFWVRMAGEFADNPRVWFGIMNEPSGNKQTPIRIRDTHHWVVNAIRARTPALNKVLCSGAQYSSCANWVRNGSGAAYATWYDPAGNSGFEPHTYFDDDASGTKGACMAGTQSRLVEITDWARANGFRLFMGELAGGDPMIDGQAACGPVVTAAYQYMSDNRDVWLGWTTWGGGRFWNRDYFFRLDPANYQTGADTGCMKMLLPFLAT